jgi:hypothetical protein
VTDSTSAGSIKVIEDTQITLGSQYHLIRPLTARGDQGLFIFIALAKSRATWRWHASNYAASGEDLPI